MARTPEVGRPGDIRIANGRLVAVVARSRSHRLVESGGNLAYLAPTGKGASTSVRTMVTFLGGSFSRQLAYRTVRVLERGGTTGRSVVEAVGADTSNRDLGVVTRYVIEPASPTIRVTTTFSNNGKRYISRLLVSDSINWDGGRLFAPGYGWEPPLAAQVTWLAASHGATSTVFSKPGGCFLYRQWGRWTDLDLGRITLKPGGTAAVSRALHVGRGGIGGPAAAAFGLMNVPLGRLTGSVVEGVPPRPLPGTEVVVSTREGRPLYSLRCGPKGGFAADVPPGEYYLTLRSLGRRGPGRVRAVVTSGQTAEVSLVASKPGRVSFNVVNGKGVPIPAKLQFEGREGTPDPMFGPPCRAFACGRVLMTPTGRGIYPLAPGTYMVTVSRGPEYGLHRALVKVPESGTARVEARLRRVVDTRGYVSLDILQRSATERSSRVALYDRIIADAVEGLEVLVLADEARTTDPRRAIAALGLERWLIGVPGRTAATVLHGSYIAFPMRTKGARALGQRSAEGMDRTDVVRWLRSDRLYKAVVASMAGARPKLRKMWSLGRRGRKRGWRRKRRRRRARRGKARSSRKRRASRRRRKVRGEPRKGATRKKARGKRVAGKRAASRGKRSRRRRRWRRGRRWRRISRKRLARLKANLARRPRIVDAVELLRRRGGEVFGARLAAWYSLLNDGFRLSPVATSTSRSLLEAPGYPRTYIPVSARSLRRVSVDQVVASLLKGRGITVTTGPFVRFAAVGASRGSRGMVRPDRGAVRVRIQVQAAPWIDVNRVDIIVNGAVGRSFNLRSSAKILRFERTESVRMKKDGWLVVIVTGERPLLPVVDGQVRPLAVAGPIWVDANGDGRITPQ